jgi:hypothetical protein
MGFLLILILFCVLADKPKPLTEQNSSELEDSQNLRNKEIRLIQLKMVNSEQNILKERQRLKLIEDNLTISFRKDKLTRMLINVIFCIYVLLGATILYYSSSEISNMPTWLQALGKLNEPLLIMLNGHFYLVLLISIIFLFVWLFQLLFKHAMVIGKQAKRTPEEKYIERKRDYLRILERNHKDYVMECEDSIKEIRVKLYEIQEFSKKRKMIKDSL